MKETVAENAKVDETRIRLKTDEVIVMLNCDKKTLLKWEKMHPGLFSPVKRQRKGNIYRPQQVKIMAEVMDGLETPESGIELWERTKRTNKNIIYRDAGDPTRRNYE